MHHGASDKLVYLHEAYHLQDRMQHAGWEPDLEKWESDHDSSDAGSDDDDYYVDERLLMI